MQVDDKLICKLLVGHDDPRGMEVLFNSYYRPLVLWADSFLGDIPAAEDLVQDSGSSELMRESLRVIFGDIFLLQ